MPCSRSDANPLPFTPRKRILHRRDDATDAGGDDSLGAGAGPAGVRAWLERAVQRRAAGGVASFDQRVHLGVRLARPLMRALPHHHTLIRDDAGADNGVGRGAAKAAPRALQRAIHPARICLGQRYHFS